MHELSIALSMIELAENEAALHDGKRVRALYLKLGALSGVVKDALLFSWEIACEGTLLAGSKLFIEDVPLVVRCRNCNEDKNLGLINSFICPDCDLPAPEIVSGKELQVTAMEIDQ